MFADNTTDVIVTVRNLVPAIIADDPSIAGDVDVTQLDGAEEQLSHSRDMLIDVKLDIRDATEHFHHVAIGIAVGAIICAINGLLCVVTRVRPRPRRATASLSGAARIVGYSVPCMRHTHACVCRRTTDNLSPACMQSKSRPPLQPAADPLPPRSSLLLLSASVGALPCVSYIHPCTSILLPGTAARAVKM